MIHSFARRERPLAILVLATLVAGVLAFLVVAAPAKANHGSRTLEVSPEVSAPKADGATPHVLTARLNQPLGPSDTDVRIDFEVESGPGDLDGNTPLVPDMTCSVKAPGATSDGMSCTASFTAGVPGTSLVRVWIDHDGLNATSEADAAEGRLSANPGDCATELSPEGGQACLAGTVVAGTTGEPDDTDVVQVNWATAASKLDCDGPSGGDQEAAPRGGSVAFTCLGLDANNVPTPGNIIDAENQDGANDGDNADAASPDFTCTTDSSGRCTITVSGAEGDLGPANVCFWVDTDNDNGYTPNSAVSEDGGGCSSEAINAPERDNTIDRATVTWADPVLDSVEIEPEVTNPALKPGDTHTVTAQLLDQFGGAWKEARVINFEFFSGSAANGDGNTPASPDRSCTTAADTGACTISYTSTVDGSDLLCGWYGDAPVLSGSTPSGTCNGENQSEVGGSKDDRLDVVSAQWKTPASSGGGSTPPPQDPQGYALVGTDGGIFNYGTAEFHGSTGDIKLNKPVVGMAYLPGGNGYWMVASDGGIFTFGKAEFYGSMADRRLNAAIIGMEATPDGKGYWLFASDGGIFSFGNAEFFGSMGDQRLNQPVVNMAANPSGKGYWLVALDGGIFSFGAAPFHGSMGDQRINQPIFDLAPTSDAGGYWLVARDGGIFSFGNASNQFFGSAVGLTSNQVIGMGPTPTYKGYWIADNKGAVFPFGDARFLGDMRNTQLNGPIIAFTTIRKK